MIMTDDISRVARAVEIGRRTLRIALQSIWIGIALSVVLMGIGAFGYIPAIAGAAIQEVVDLLTILNALRARSAGRDGRARRRDRRRRRIEALFGRGALSLAVPGVCRRL